MVQLMAEEKDQEKDTLSENRQSVSDKVYSMPPYYWSSPWPTYPYYHGQNWYTPNTKNPDSIASQKTVDEESHESLSSTEENDSEPIISFICLVLSLYYCHTLHAHHTHSHVYPWCMSHIIS